MKKALLILFLIIACYLFFVIFFKQEIQVSKWQPNKNPIIDVWPTVSPDFPWETKIAPLGEFYSNASYLVSPHRNSE